MCSKQYLAIIIDNLVRNALQHTNHGTVTVLFENNQVIVQDTGAGMDDSCAQEPSHNVLDKSGVGLSIVKRLSDKQGWQVHVKSKLGEGTNVFVDI
jgi:signal transduction histidine kinase